MLASAEGCVPSTRSLGWKDGPLWGPKLQSPAGLCLWAGHSQDDALTRQLVPSASQCANLGHCPSPAPKQKTLLPPVFSASPLLTQSRPRASCPQPTAISCLHMTPPSLFIPSMVTSLLTSPENPLLPEAIAPQRPSSLAGPSQEAPSTLPSAALCLWAPPALLGRPTLSCLGITASRPRPTLLPASGPSATAEYLLAPRPLGSLNSSDSGTTLGPWLPWGLTPGRRPPFPLSDHSLPLRCPPPGLCLPGTCSLLLVSALILGLSNTPTSHSRTHHRGCL